MSFIERQGTDQWAAMPVLSSRIVIRKEGKEAFAYEPLMGRRRVSDRSQGSHAPGSARVAVFALPPLGGTTLVPIPRAGARAQGLLQGLGVRETLVRGLGQTS
jgi:hypothetical protein